MPPESSALLGTTTSPTGDANVPDVAADVELLTGTATNVPEADSRSHESDATQTANSETDAEETDCRTRVGRMSNPPKRFFL